MPALLGQSNVNSKGSVILVLSTKIKGIGHFSSENENLAIPFFMQRKGDLKHLWCNYDALLDAWWEVKRNKGCYFSILDYELNLAVNLSNLLIRLENECYEPYPLRSFYIHEPKTRLIEAPHVEDRIVQHALLNVIRPIIERRFIDQTYACRKFKGTHASNDQLKSYLVNYKSQGYYLKIDIRKFFYSINHEVLEHQLGRILKCKKTLQLLSKFYENTAGVGLPLGNVTSQLLANLALNPIDHFVKRVLKFKHYVRYMDDMVLLSTSKDDLHNAITLLEIEINTLGLVLNSKTKISRIVDGIDFVGYRTWYNRRVIRKRSLYKIKRKLRKDANLNRVASYLSHAMRTNSIVYVIKQILSVSPELRPWVIIWYRQHFKNRNKMIYLKAKQIEKDNNIIGLQMPQNDQGDLFPHFMYDRDAFGCETHGIDCSQQDAELIISTQDTQCEVSQVQHSEIEPILKACRWYKEIDVRCIAKIGKRYDITREISIIKLGNNHPDFIEMQSYIDLCRAEADMEKRSIGLKLPEE